MRQISKLNDKFYHLKKPQMDRLIFSTLFIFSNLFFGVLSNENVKLNKYCSYNAKNSELTCENFDNFNQLGFGQIKPIDIKILRLIPSVKIEFNNDLTDQIELIASYFKPNYSVHLSNLDGFDFESNPFVFVKSSANQLFLKNLTLSFRKNGQSLNSDCNLIDKKIVFI